MAVVAAGPLLIGVGHLSTNGQVFNLIHTADQVAVLVLIFGSVTGSAGHLALIILLVDTPHLELVANLVVNPQPILAGVPGLHPVTPVNHLTPSGDGGSSDRHFEVKIIGSNIKSVVAGVPSVHAVIGHMEAGVQRGAADRLHVNC